MPTESIPESAPNLPNVSLQQEFLTGARDMIPLVVGAIPFGIIFGTLAQDLGLTYPATVGMSAIVFAGSSQFVALKLLEVGSTVQLIILTTFFVNLRHMLYAASLLPRIRSLNSVWKLMIGFWLTDEAYAVAIRRYLQPDASPYKHWYYLGAALCMYINWQFSTWIGLTLGQLVPNAATWGLDFSMVATFIGMIIPHVTTRPMIATVLTAGIVSLLANSLPHQLGLIVAAIVAVIVGMIVED